MAADEDFLRAAKKRMAADKALLRAAKKGDESLALRALRAGADINAIDLNAIDLYAIDVDDNNRNPTYGKTVAQVALYHGHPEFVLVLARKALSLEHKALSLEHKALSAAIAGGDDIKGIRVLLEQYQTLAQKLLDAKKLTYREWIKDVSTLKMVAEIRPVIWEDCTEDGKPIEYSSWEDYIEDDELVQYCSMWIEFLEKEQSALEEFFFRALRGEEEENIKSLLIEYPHLLHAVSSHGTPLHMAVIGGNIRIVQLLLDHGAHRGVSHKNRTPAQLAEKVGNMDIAYLLQNYLEKKDEPVLQSEIENAIVAVEEGNKSIGLNPYGWFFAAASRVSQILSAITPYSGPSF